MKFLRFFKQKKQKDFLVLDFGTSSVKGLIFEKRAKVNLIKKFSIGEIEKFGVLSADDFELAIVKKATQKVIDELGIQEQISEMPILLGFSPKILKARIIKVLVKRKNKGQKITKEEEQRIYRSVLKKAEKQVSDQFQKEFGIIPQDLKILKREILGNKISGYNIHSLLGQTGENLDFKILIVLGLRDNLKIFQQLKTFLGSENINLFHEIEGLVVTVRNKNLTGIFLDIGKEFTQIFSIKKGVEWIGEFPVGGAIFTREICQNLGLTEKEGEELKRRFFKNQLSKGVRQKIEDIVSETSKIWLTQLKEKLRKKTKGYTSLAGSLYLMGGGSLSPGIKKVLERESSKAFPLPQTLKVNFLKVKDLPLEVQGSIPLSPRALPPILLTFSKYAKKDY